MVINPHIKQNDVVNDVFSANLENGVIYLIGEVTDELAASVTAQMLMLDARGETDISIYINSPGGSVAAGLSIYDTMKYLEKSSGMTIRTICQGRAASMGAVILSGGTKGYRSVLPHAEVMIHQPSGGMEGKSSDMNVAVQHILNTQSVLNNILAENTGKDPEEIKNDTDRDYWMSADMAVEYGIVDKKLEY